MCSRTFATLASWALILAVCAAPDCLASSIITTPTPADASLSMLELETALFGWDEADGYSIAQQSQLWTTDANAALYTNLLELITTLGGDQAMIAELFQPGAIFAGQTNPQSALTSQVLAQAQDLSVPSAIPEPATMGLLGGTLLFFCCYSFHRTRSMKPADEPIRQTD